MGLQTSLAVQRCSPIFSPPHPGLCQLPLDQTPPVAFLHARPLSGQILPNHLLEKSVQSCALTYRILETASSQKQANGLVIELDVTSDVCRRLRSPHLPSSFLAF